MATKKINIYSSLESTSNQKVEDLYIIVDQNNIIFYVKNKKSNQTVAFEHFVKDAADTRWQEIDNYIQKNSKLVSGFYASIYFIINSPKFILTNKLVKEDTLIYWEELNMVHGKSNDEELYITPFNDNLVVAFAVPDAISTFLSRLFPSGKWHHYAAYVLATASLNEVLVYLFDNTFCLRIVMDGKTQFIQYFMIESHGSNCYQILNACSNTNIKTNASKIKVWGYHDDHHQFIQKIAPYFAEGEIVETPNNGIGVTLNESYPQNIYSTYFIF